DTALSTSAWPTAAARVRVRTARGSRLRSARAMPVPTHDGHSTEQPTRSPTRDRSWYNVSDSDTTACLATLYGPVNGGSTSPATEAVLTTWPREPGSPAAASSMRGTKARTPWVAPHRFTPSTHSQSWTLASQTI